MRLKFRPIPRHVAMARHGSAMSRASSAAPTGWRRWRRCFHMCRLRQRRRGLARSPGGRARRPDRRGRSGRRRTGPGASGHAAARAGGDRRAARRRRRHDPPADARRRRRHPARAGQRCGPGAQSGAAAGQQRGRRPARRLRQGDWPDQGGRRDRRHRAGNPDRRHAGRPRRHRRRCVLCRSGPAVRPWRPLSRPGRGHDRDRDPGRRRAARRGRPGLGHRPSSQRGAVAGRPARTDAARDPRPQ